MDDVRYWPPVLILILVVGGLFGFRYLDQVDTANSALVDAKLVLAQTRESLEAKKATWSAIEASSLKLAKARQKQKEIAVIQDEADKKQRLVEGDLSYTLKSFRAVVDKVRADAVGCEIPELVLLNGTVLTNAKIRKVDNNSISFFHSTGISSVPFEQLSKDLIEKFDLGPGSLVAQMERLESGVDNADNTAKTEPSSELLAIRKKIVHLEIQIEGAIKHKDKLEAESLSYDDKIKEAESKNQFTFNMRTMKDVAEANAGAARNEVKSLIAELEKLRAEESALLNRQ